MRQPVFLLMTALALVGCSKAPPAEEPVRAVRTMTVQPGSLSLQHEYAAEIRARTESRLSFRVPGKLVARTASLGEHVAAGKPLARLDAGDLALGQQAAQAALRAAEVQRTQADAEFKRFKELRDQGFISGLELERRESALKAAQAQVEQAQAQLSLQASQTGHTVLTAMTSGVVTSVDAEPGMVLAAGMPVLRLAHDGPRDAVFSVPEDRVDAVRALLGKPGALRLRLWGASDEAMPVTVRELAAAADPMTRTYLVKADVGTAPVRLGQTATVLVAAPVSSSIKLPLNTVFGQAGQSAVWLVDRATMTVRQQPITVKGAEGNLVIVASGLKPGDVVVTAGVHALAGGQKVRWYNEPAPAAAAPTASSAAPTSAPKTAPAASAASR